MRDLVDECAMYPSMSAQPDVASRHARLAAPGQRRSLAGSLRQMADGGGHTGAAAGTDPVAVARLRTLVRSGIISPLYNSTLPAELLDVILSHALYRITAGTAAARARRIQESSR